MANKNMTIVDLSDDENEDVTLAAESEDEDVDDEVDTTVTGKLVKAGTSAVVNAFSSKRVNVTTGAGKTRKSDSNIMTTVVPKTKKRTTKTSSPPRSAIDEEEDEDDVFNGDATEDVVELDIQEDDFMDLVTERGADPINAKNKVIARGFVSNMNVSEIMSRIQAHQAATKALTKMVSAHCTGGTAFIKLVQLTDLNSPDNKMIIIKYANSLAKASKSLLKLCGVEEKKATKTSAKTTRLNAISFTS